MRLNRRLKLFMNQGLINLKCMINFAKHKPWLFMNQGLLVNIDGSRPADTQRLGNHIIKMNFILV